MNSLQQSMSYVDGDPHFAWHWHNSSNKNREIQKGSKFDLLRNRTEKLLKEKGL